MSFAAPQRQGDTVGEKVGAPDVADLSLLYQGFQRADSLLERGTAVPLVDLVEVDVVNTEPRETVITGRNHVLAGKACIISATAGRETHLRGH